jgi:threonine synthase
LPVGKLIIATNHNDILTRCVATGEYRSDAVIPSLSPSMDIQISSNFERLLFELYDHDSAAINELMRALREEGGFTLSPAVHRRLQQHFLAARADDSQTQAAIRSIYKTTGEILDPHSAVGIWAAEQHRNTLTGPLVTLATAHPAKFPAAVKEAISVDPALPPHLQDIWQKEERFSVLPASVDAVRQFVEQAS